LDLCIDARNNNVQIESLMVSMLELDERKFLNVLSGAIIKFGFEETVEKVLFPFLERIGMLWQAGTVNPAQEHFISNLVRQKLIVAIDNEIQNVTVNGPRVIFFLPEGELHEIGLLFFNLIARKEGLDVIYLGMSVPLGDLKMVNQVRPADAFFTSFVSAKEKIEIESMLQQLRNYFPGTPFLVNGLQIKELNPRLPENFTVVSSIKTFKESVKLLKYSE
jgi:methanogenic corrinoid protein MtbC1